MNEKRFLHEALSIQVSYSIADKGVIRNKRCTSSFTPRCFRSLGHRIRAEFILYIIRWLLCQNWLLHRLRGRDNSIMPGHATHDHPHIRSEVPFGAFNDDAIHAVLGTYPSLEIFGLYHTTDLHVIPGLRTLESIMQFHIELIMPEKSGSRRV